jgi:peroxiredoxin
MIFRCSSVLGGFLYVVFASLGQSPVPRSQDHNSALLEKISEKYDSLSGYEFKGRQGVSLGEDCQIEFPFEASGGGRLAKPWTITFHSLRPTQACMTQIEKLGSLGTPALWADFSIINLGVRTVRKLRTEVLHPTGRDIRCVVLEVRYDEYNERVRNIMGPVLYWIDAGSGDVWRAQFDENAESGTRHWTVNIESISVLRSRETNADSDAVASFTTLPLVGQPAPDFALLASDGGTVRLPDFRGKVVLLAFWATWCTACEVEIPMLERLQTAPGSNIVVLGVSEEKATVVEEWSRKYGRSFRTLVDAKDTEEVFGIHGIPALVVVDQRGIVRDYVTGIQSEGRLRELLERESHN